MNTDASLIIGAGIAGLYTALNMAPHPVTVLTSGSLGGRAASSWAQGGLAAAMGADDSAADHAADTIAAGGGLVDAEATTILTKAGPDRIHDLLRMGVPFDRHPDGTFKLGREAAHGRDRIVHVGGDEAGAEIMRVLIDQAKAAPHITLIERHVAYRLLFSDGQVCGTMAWDRDTQAHRVFRAAKTVLATGGIGGLFAVTTNPLTARGQGLALAYHAGATLRDLEFVQFHPTGVDIGKDPAPLATEALRGDGATLRDVHGRPAMAGIDPRGDLAPRDIVARGVATAIAKTGGAFLDAREAIGPQFKARYPTVYAACMEAGIDPSIKPIPVAPAAHYHMGGVLTDIDGHSSLPGLYAVGEVASTGIHGANRLASNSLLEALVFGKRAAAALLGDEITPVSGSADTSAAAFPLAPAKAAKPLRKIMSSACGLLRDVHGLQSAIDAVTSTSAETQGDFLDLTTMELILRAALSRKESRGAHQRTDYPELGSPRHTITKRNRP